MESKLVYPVSNVLQRLALRTFSDWKVEGRGQVPSIGPLLIVANHQSNFDPTLLAASLPRRVWFLAKDGIFRGPFANWFLRSYGAFPVNREGTDLRAYRWALGKLEKGEVVVIFPEGTRSAGGMKQGKPGIAQLALKSQAPILPVGITGTAHMGTWMRIFNPTGKLRVNVGRVFNIPDVEGKPSKEVLQSLTDIIMRRVAELLPNEYQGVYGLMEDASNSHHSEVSLSP